MFNVQRGGKFASFNAAAKSSADGPSLAEIRNVEVQKSAPAEENLRNETSQDNPEEQADEEEGQAA